MVVADLFVEQSQRWELIARGHIDKVWTAAHHFVDLVVDHIADKSTAGSLKQEIFQPEMEELRSRMREKTTELLLPYQAGHPITYNHDFTETFQKVRLGRNRKDPGEVLREFFGVRDLKSHYLDGHYDLSRLAASLAVLNEPAMTRPAAVEAMNCLDAYYKVGTTSPEWPADAVTNF
jgi:hypothetical protein